MKPIKFVEVKSELGAGTRGASLGIDAIKIASVNAKSDLFTRFDSIEVKTDNSPLYRDTKYTTAKRISDILSVERVTCELVAEVANEYFPLVLAGDHSTAAGDHHGIEKSPSG